MRGNRAAAWLAGLLAAAAPLMAQAPATVTGSVIDAATQAPVPEADVRLGDQHQVTGNDGNFRFGSVTPGSRLVEVRRIGYAPAQETIEVLPGLESRLSLRLQPLPIQLDSLVVTAQDVGSIAIRNSDLIRRGSDLARALDGWEGVTVRRSVGSGPASPQVRGSAPDEVLVLLDGFSLNDPLTGRADLSRISSRDVERVTLLPGAQGARMGSRAIAGVIVVETRAHFDPELFSQVSSFGGLEGRLGASLGSLAVALGAQRYADDYPYQIPAGSGGGEGQRTNAGGYVATLTARRPGPVDFQLRGNFADRELPGIVTNPTPTARAQDGMAFLGARHTGAFSWSGSVQWLTSRVWDPGPPVPFQPYDTRTSGGELTAGAGLRRGLRLPGWSGDAGIGLDGRYDRFVGDGVEPGSDFLLGSLRADGNWRRGESSVWSLAPVLRLDQWTGRATPIASGRIDAGWRRSGSAVMLGVGSGVTPPALLDLFFREGVGVQLNPDLRPERVRWEVTGGFTQSVGTSRTGATFSLRGYVGRVADMILWSSNFRGIWSPGNFDVFRRGGEASVSVRPLAALRLEGSAGVSRVTYDRPGGEQVAYRPLGTAAASAVWSPGVWSADVRWHFVGLRYRDNSAVNALPTINLLDLGIQRELGAVAVLRAAVSDLTDQRAEFISGYPTPGRTFTLSIDVRP
jgi:iron complex outermembrane receptor protein